MAKFHNGVMLKTKSLKQQKTGILKICHNISITQNAKFNTECEI